MKRQFTTDDRGVSEVIGAILVFGLLIALMAILQMQAVPAANEEVEFNHNQDVQSDLVDFHATASRVLNDGKKESVRVRMGTTYPSRMLFFSPRNPDGTLRTTEPRSATISNVASPNSDVQAYIADSAGAFTVDFRSLEYRPKYNEYSSSPTTRYEYGGLYNEHDDIRNETISNHGYIIDGSDISLISTAGDLSHTTGGTRSIDVEPAAAPPSTVTITNDSPGPVVLNLPTGLSKATWDELLEDEMVAQGGNVQNYDVDEDAGEIRIELQGGVMYSMEMPRVSVANSSPEVEPAYIAPSGSGVVQATPGQRVKLSAEVRDEYNNPIPDASVTFDVPSGPTQSVQADSDGKATFEYTAPSSVGNQNVDVETDEFNGNLNSTDIEVQVGGTSAGPVIITDSAIDRGSDQIELTLQNEGEDISVQRVQLRYASEGATSQLLTAGITKPPSIQEGPTSIDEISFLGTSDSSFTANEGQAPAGVSILSGGNPATLSSGSTDTMVFTLDDISDNNENAVMFSVRVFYSGGYNEIYSVQFAPT